MAAYHVQRYRLAQKLSLKDLAVGTGISARRLGNMERGETEWKVKDLERCAAALKVKVSDLYTPDDANPTAATLPSASRPAETHVMRCLCGRVVLSVVVPRGWTPGDGSTRQETCQVWTACDGSGEPGLRQQEYTHE